MRPDRLAIGTIGALVIIAFIAIWQQREVSAELRRQIGDLERALGRSIANGVTPEASVNVSGAGVSANERGELARLRAEISVLKVRTQELAVAVKQSAGNVPLNLVPASGWRNAGTESPEAAAESFMWASDSGDLDALANTILLDAAAREKAAAILARLSDSARATYNTPEKFVALLLARDTDARAMQVLGANTAGDDALVSLRLQKEDGKTKDEGYQFKRTTDGWRLVVPGKAVDKMGKKLTDPPKK